MSRERELCRSTCELLDRIEEKRAIASGLLPRGTRVEHRRTGMRGTVARHDYGENTIAADKAFEGRNGMLADGFWAKTADLIVLPSLPAGRLMSSSGDKTAAKSSEPGGAESGGPPDSRAGTDQTRQEPPEL